MPSMFWTQRPVNCRGDPAKDPQACGRWGAHKNPGSNCELNAIVATLSTGPVGLGDKEGATNATIVRRCVRQDGRILQPDKPATSVDSMFWQSETGTPARSAPPGHVWAAMTSVKEREASPGVVWHWILSIDVITPWKLHGADLYPMLPNSAAEQAERLVADRHAEEGWVVHDWFTGHSPTNCRDGTKAVASGCVRAVVRSAADIPAIHNKRPIMVRNDTHVFDLTELAPVKGGWVLLGEVNRYVRQHTLPFVTV